MINRQVESNSRIQFDKLQEVTAILEPERRKIFASWLQILNEEGIPYVLGGAFAVYAYTGVWRDTKDLDVFLRPGDLRKALDALKAGGFETEIRSVFWLAKVHYKPYFMDLIFGTSSTQFLIDDSWFEFSQPIEILGVRSRLIALEELIASKVYMAKSDRFDGANIVHLIRCVKGRIDWQRILTHLKDNQEILLWYLLFFDFVYPSHSDYLPQELMVKLFEKIRENWSRPKRPGAFRGMLLDPLAFAVDCKAWNYENGCHLVPLVDKRGELV